MKKFLLVGVMQLALVMGIMPLGLAAAQEDERPTVALLAADEPHEDSFTEDITARRYAFFASEGDVVSISMVQDSDSPTLDPYLVLLGPAGEMLGWDDDGGEVAFSSLISDVTIPADGAYNILATSLSGIREDSLSLGPETSELNFTISVTGNNIAPDTDTDTIIILAGRIEVGDTANLSNTNEEPVYYIKFDATEGQVLEITMQSTAFDSLLFLFDTEGNRVAVDDDSAGGLDAQISGYVVPEDGTYLLWATTYGFISDNVYAEDGSPFTISIVAQ